MPGELSPDYSRISLFNRVMSIASLFEADFYIDWLQELADIKTRQALTILEEGLAQSLIISTAPGRYRFTNRGKRNALAALLDASETREFHQGIARLLLGEVMSKQEAAIQVSGHLLHIDNDLDGCQWLFKAGEQYRKNHQHSRAMDCYQKIISDLSSIESAEADWLFTEAVIGYSKISEAAETFSDVITLLLTAQKRAKRINNNIQQALLCMHLAKNEWLSSNYDTALKHFEKGLTLSKPLDDLRLQRATMTFRTFFSYWQAEYAEAVDLYESFASEIEKHETRIFPLLASEMVAVCYTAVGQATQGLGMLDSLLTHCRNTNEGFVASYAAAYISSIMFEFGNYKEALKYHAEALTFAKPYKNHLMKISLLLLAAAIHYRKNEPDRAIKYFKLYLKKRINPSIVGIFAPYYLELCWAIEQGRLPGINHLKQRDEIKGAVNYQNLLMKGAGYRYLALLEKENQQGYEKIIPLFQSSLKYLEKSGHRLEQAKTKVLLAAEYLACEQVQDAKELIQSILPEIDLYGDPLIPPELRYLVKESRSEENLLGEIMKLSQEIVSIRDNTELVSKILSTTNRLTNAERGAIFMLKHETGTPGLELRASKNLAANDIIEPTFEASLKLIKKAGNIGKGYIQVDAVPGGSAHISQNTILSSIAVPMKLRDKVVGVLYHDNRVFPNTFQRSDLELLEHFSAMAAITMDNVRAYEEIQDLYQRLNEEKQYYVEQHLEALHFDEFVGESPSIRQVFSAIDRVASTEANVLILGETGVGKELVARAIHNNSPRRHKPFVRVNCSALPDSLVSSELFGHEKGAFTGAVDRKIGRFELADGGTLFLDEIGDISLDVQVNLLRVLQSKEFERLGGKTTLHSDFRLISATNRDLKKRVKNKQFRQDLFYRLNVFPIFIPPLSSRQSDIPLLVQHFLKIYSAKMGKPPMKISEKEMQRLMNYSWPGNIRELENIIERGVILGKNDRFRLPKLIETYQNGSVESAILTMEEMERQHVLQALEATNWKIRGAGGTSEVLDMHPSTLYSRIKKLGLKKPTS